MECPVCLEAWHLQQVRPKVFAPCGHGVCAVCVESLQDRRCPTCRQVFADPVVDNYPLIALLESSLGWTGSPVSWCLSCKRPSSVQCVVAEHDVKRPKAALRRGLAGLATRCSQLLQGIEADCLQDLQDGHALAALELLDAERAACKLAMTLDDGRVVSPEWQDGLSALAEICLVAATAKGRAEVQASGESQGAAQQSAVRRVPSAPRQPAAQRDVEVQEPDFGSLSREQGPGSMQEEKDQALLFCRQGGVRRIPLLRCHRDPAWSLDVLQLAAPTLVEVRLVHPAVEHLAAVRAMPRLQLLWLDGLSDDHRCSGLAARPLHRGSLKYLRVHGVPQDATWSLLKGHAASLEVACLGLDAEPGRQWPWECGPAELDRQLRKCGLRRLRLLVLWRNLRCEAARCGAQLEAARGALQGCKVQCFQCDKNAT